MRTTTRRGGGLVAGAGAAVIVLAGAASAAAVPGQPGEAYWESYFANQGYEGVSCYVSNVNGAPGVLAVEIGENWSGSLAQDNEWVGVVIEVDGQQDQYDVHPWEGYQAYRYGLDLPEDATGSITNAIVCQADEGSGGGGEDQEVELPDEAAGQTEAPGDADQTDDGDQGDQTSAPTETDGPTGPAVETDGPATPGTDLGMLGGAALVLAGAGAAGWAMRRRPAEH